MATSVRKMFNINTKRMPDVEQDMHSTHHVPSAHYHLHYHPINGSTGIYPMGASTSEMDAYTFARWAEVWMND
jgi:hypothetical protein